MTLFNRIALLLPLAGASSAAMADATQSHAEGFLDGSTGACSTAACSTSATIAMAHATAVPATPSSRAANAATRPENGPTA